MKHIKLFEQFEYDDPFGEEIHNFNVGDILICIEPGKLELEMGEEYELIKKWEDEYVGFICVVKDKRGKLFSGWRLNRFDKK